MISIVVPCYNEEQRIDEFLAKLLKSFSNHEIVIVNDGSTDGTLGVLKALARGKKNVRVVSYKENKGKGYAVKTGMLAAKGDFIIFIDADGSIDPGEIRKMEKYVDKYDVIVGTRASKLSVVKQPKKRKFLGVLFNLAVNIVFQTGIKDSLCGFKGFQRAAARNLFGDLKSNRWVFDVELFYKIRKQKYTLYQMPIHWVHKGKSKIKPLDPVKMLIQVVALRFRLLFK